MARIIRAATYKRVEEKLTGAAWLRKIKKTIRTVKEKIDKEEKKDG